MSSKPGRIGRDISDPSEMSLPRDDLEALASIEGQMAMFLLERMPSPSRQRLMAFHKLRGAARRDPIAAYNLGNYMSESAEMDRGRRRRKNVAMRLFEDSAVMGMERLRNASEPFRKAPRAERDLRDIVSRALTNIGGHIANSGFPERAVEHFRRSITVFPDNPNTHVCLGNMAVYYAKETGIDPIDGIASWETAARIGDYCHESDHGCPCRENVVRVARQIERDYGKDEARAWVTKRYAVACDSKSLRDFAPVARTADDVDRLTGRRWTADAIRTADIVGEGLASLRDAPLEIKVTLAGCILGTLSRLGGLDRPGDPAILQAGVDGAHAVEPLHPFLGDHEWRNLSPPETLYLLEDDVRLGILGIAMDTVDDLLSEMPDLKREDAVIGALFHLDRKFRKGVTYMISNTVKEACEEFTYVPATVIGAPARQ